MTKIERATGLGLILLLSIVAIMLWSGGINAGTPLTWSIYGPPTRIPPGGTGGTDTEPDSAVGPNQGLEELQVLSGHGTDQAKQAYDAAVASLPFTPHQFTNLPEGFVLYHVDANLEPTEKTASFGALYLKQLSQGRIELHTFQTNDVSEPKAAPEAQKYWAETKQIQIGGKSWKYILIAQPQPGGSQIKLHYISRVADGVRVIIDIQGNAPDAELLKLLEAAALSLN